MMELSAGNGAQTVLRVWLGIAGALLCVTLSALAGLITPWLLTAAAAAGIATVAGTLWYPQRYCESVKGTFNGIAVEITLGVLWKKRLYVPVASLRTVEYRQTPLQRRFGCCTVVLRFAGGAAHLSMLSEQSGVNLANAVEKTKADNDVPVEHSESGGGE